jgi:dTDP-4-dehydrorhamnose reductase
LRDPQRGKRRLTLAAVFSCKAFNPDLVVNAAGYTAVDKAEDDKEAAFAINRDGAGFVTAAAEAADATTDYVFDGKKQTTYLAKPLAKNEYGRYLLRLVEDEQQSWT